MTPRALSQIRAQAGSKGGRATATRHGRAHMQAIGRRGAQALHARYSLQPFGLDDFALVSRTTGQIRALLSGEKIPLWAQGPAPDPTLPGPGRAASAPDQAARS